MTSQRSSFVRAVTIVACLAGHAPICSAQGIEVAPFGGYRFGGDFFELITGQPVDLDGTVALGVLFDVPLSKGLQFEGLFTHQHAHVTVPAQLFRPATLWRMSVDHWLAGGLQEFRRGRMRPFLTGTLGLTRYSAEADSEVRFAVAAGGGMKLFPSRHVGLRLDGRVFTTFVDAGATLIACSPGACFLAIHASVVWQAEFTTGIVVRFP
jgi:hypothetical protein